jgi:hypothetical protein
MKTFQHPNTKEIRTANNDESVKIAALKKLGYVEITGDDITNEPSLGVTYEPVAKATQPAEPPALPKLTKPVPPAPTRDPGAPKQASGKAITREDVAPLSDDKK